MKSIFRCLLVLLPLFAPPLFAQSSPAPDLTAQVRSTLLNLPYYGPFDLLAFEVDGGTVTLGGQVYIGSLREEAEAAVKRLPGVQQIVNKIELLPASLEDDRLRRALFWRIYDDGFLMKYGTPSGLLGRASWGHSYRHWGGFARGSWSRAPFWGLEPLGDYAIHIVVKNGQVALFGTVINEPDRDKAALSARGILGVLGVDNQIQVEKT